MLIVASEPRELRWLVRLGQTWHGFDAGLWWSQEGMLGSNRVVLAANGAGRANAGRVVERLSDRFPVRAVISTGSCGGLDPVLPAGRVVVAERVLSLSPAGEFAARIPDCPPAVEITRGAVLTVDRFVQTREEKRSLRSTGAVAVEMESAGVAAEAHNRGLPFYCVRAVSDDAATSFQIDFNRARRPDGRFSRARVVARAGMRPARWKELLGLWRVDRAASRALGEFLGQCQFER